MKAFSRARFRMNSPGIGAAPFPGGNSGGGFSKLSFSVMKSVF